MNQEHVTVERYKRLVDYVNELAQNCNNMEERIAVLEKQAHESGKPDLQGEIVFESEPTK